MLTILIFAVWLQTGIFIAIPKDRILCLYLMVSIIRGLKSSLLMRNIRIFG